MPKKVIIIGSGFAGLSAASYLAFQGFEVSILEKNSSLGGRARKFEENGFTFDMGPSWYWMPDVFEGFFRAFGKKPSDYYDLIRLDPSYTIFFNHNHKMEVPAAMKELFGMFERYEAGSSQHLKKFLEEAKYKYEVGMGEFVSKPSHSILEFADIRLLRSLFRLQMFQSLSKHVRGLFKNPHLRQLLEFPVLFLGATPQNTPAMYSLMNYADMSLGTWYPQGGMHKIIEGMVSLAKELGVTILVNQEVERIQVSKALATEVITKERSFKADVVVASADYHHVDQYLLPTDYRNYSKSYWEKRVMAPSSLLFYIGVNKKVKGLYHHNLFFDESFQQHAVEIYDTPKWPSKPLFYVCCPSKTDSSVAPEGSENLFLLIPVAPDLSDTPEIREKYFHIIMDRLESHTGQNIREAIAYKRSYAHLDFQKDYHAFKGNAYGLANTLGQTAFLKPKLRNKKIRNLFYTGQLTVPGPGVPPSLISGQVVAHEVARNFI